MSQDTLDSSQQPTTHARQPCEYVINPIELGDPSDPLVIEVTNDLAIEHTTALTSNNMPEVTLVADVSLDGLNRIVEKGERAAQIISDLNCLSCVAYVDCGTRKELSESSNGRASLAHELIKRVSIEQEAAANEEASIRAKVNAIAIKKSKEAIRSKILARHFNAWVLAGSDKSSQYSNLERIYQHNRHAAAFMEIILSGYRTAPERDKAANSVLELIGGNPEKVSQFYEFMTGITNEVTVYEQLKIVAQECDPKWEVRLSSATEDVEQGFDILVDVPIDDSTSERVLIDAKCRSEFEKLMDGRKNHKNPGIQRLNAYLGVKLRKGNNILVVNPQGQQNSLNPSIYDYAQSTRLPTFQVREHIATDFRKRLKTVAEKRKVFIRTHQLAS